MEDYDTLDLSKLHLPVLDTRKFPKGNFIQDLEAIKVSSGRTNSEGRNLRDMQNLRKAVLLCGVPQPGASQY